MQQADQSLFLLFRLLQTSLEAIDAASTSRCLLLARVDGMTSAARFHRLLFDRAGDQIDSTAVGAGCFSFLEHFGVDGGFHK